MKKGYLLTFVFQVIALGSLAQQKPHYNFNNGVQWTFKEKMKMSLEQIKNFKPSENSVTGNLNTKDFNIDFPIDNTTDIESELHAAINPTDTANIVVSPIYQDYANGNIYCPVYYTTDFGQTWQKSTFQNMPHVAGDISGGGGDPVFTYDADGRLYFTWIDLYGSQSDFLYGTVNMGIFWAYSDDKGATWTQPANDTVLLGQMNMALGMPTGTASPVSDKQWMDADRTNSPYHNNVYISYVTIFQDGNGNTTYTIKCKTKPAGADAFTTEATITDSTFVFTQFSSLKVDNAGNVHVTFYGSKQDSVLALWHSVSVDGGVTFSTPNKISNVRFNLPMFQVQPYDTIEGINQQRLYPSPYMASNPNNGDIYITWTAFGIDSLSGTGSDVYFSKSSDNGTTWSTPVIVNDDATNNHNYYSSIFVNDLGEILIGFYDRRNDLANNLNTDFYYAISDDNGQTFTNYSATSTTTDFSTVGSQNQNFGIGEYTQILGTENYIIPVWTDGRKNNGDLDIYTAFINKNTVGIERITNVSNPFNVKLYPNPARDNVSMEINLSATENVLFTLFDNNGKIIQDKCFSKTLSKGANNVITNLEGLMPGNYHYLLKAGKQEQVVSFQIVK